MNAQDRSIIARNTKRTTTRKGNEMTAKKTTAKKTTARKPATGKPKVALDIATYKHIVKIAAENKGSRAEVLRRMPSLTPAIVGKVLAASGSTKSKPEVVERDREVVAKWLAASGEKGANLKPWAKAPRTRKAAAAA